MSFFHFLCTAEASEKYCRMVRLWAWSLKNKSQVFSDSRVTITFNDKVDYQTAEWLKRFHNVEICVRPRISKKHKEVNKYNSLWAPNLEKSEWLILTDCDIVFANSIEPLAKLINGIEFGAAPEGHNPANPPPGRPKNYKAIRNYEELLLTETSLSPNELKKHIHPWFTDKWPCTSYPYFNGGFLVLKTSKLQEFRETVLSLSQKLYMQVRKNHPNPFCFLKRFWNSRWDRTRWADHLCIGPFFRQRYADQVALAIAAIKLNLKYTILPHSYNWRCIGMGHGEELPPRVIHYFRPAFGIPLEDILNDYWIKNFLASENPGKQALAQIVSEFLSVDTATDNSNENNRKHLTF